MLPHSSTLGPITPEAAVAWFKGSRVVDENGAPLVVYRGEHGLLEGGTTGLQSRSGSFTFGTAQAASLYANEPNDRANDHEALQPRVFPALLHISNPLVESQDDPFIDLSRLREVLGDDQARRIAIKFSGHIENTGNWQESFAEQHPDIDLYLRDASGEALDALYMVLFPILDDPVEVGLLQAAGFDGAIYGGSGETAVEPEYRVFSEDQVSYPLSIGWPAAPVAAPTESLLPGLPAHQVTEQPVPQAEYQPSSIKMVRDAIAELIGPGAVRLSEGLGRLVVTTSRELSASPQFPDGHYQLGNEVLSSFAADDGFQRMLAEQRAAKKRAIEAIGDVGECAIVRHANGTDRWQMILRDASEPGKWRTQSFDRKGFSGHMVYATRDQAIEAAVSSGFTVRDDSALDRIQGTPEFQRGLFATDLIGKVNAGVITFAAANEKLAEYDRIEAVRQSLSMSRAQAFITQDTIYLLADHIEAGDEKSVYLHEVTHRHGRSALGPHGWSHVLGTLKSWADRPQRTVERSIHDAARQRALDGSRGRADVFDEELFAYSVEEAVSRGITPRAGAHPESAQAWLDDVVGMLRGLVHQMMGKEVNVISSTQDLVDMAYALAQIENPARMQRVLQRMSLQEQAVLRRMMEGALHAPAHPELSTHVLLHVAQPMMAIQWAEWVRSESTQAPEVLAGQIAASNVLAWLQDQPEERMLGVQDVMSYLDTLQNEVGDSTPAAGVAVEPDALLEAPGPFTDWLHDQGKAAFARWTDDLPVVGEHEYPSTYLGGAAVFEVFHGTTHADITEFKRQGHATGFLGKGPYFSTSSSDVSINYAGVGPDATTNLGLLSEDIALNGDQDDGVAAEFLISYFKAAGISEEVDDDNVIDLWEEHREAAAQHHARISLLGDSDGLMMKVFVKLKRPLDTLYGEMTYERIFDEDNGDLMDEQGTLVDWIVAARIVGRRLDNSEKMEGYIDACLSAVEGEGVISVEEILALALRDLYGLYDEDEVMAPGGVVSMIAEEAGYDGVVMDAWKHLGRRPSGPRIVVGGMEGLREETLHVLPFAPEQVKSATGNRGTFDPNSPDIRMSEVVDAAVSEAQTDSPEFAAWFKDSKVVDTDGNPLVLFHATFADFNLFDRRKSFDGGFHFGSKAAANQRNEYWLKGATDEAQPNIMPVYLSIQHPAVLEYDPGEPEEWIDVIEQAAEAGHDGIVYRNTVEDKGVDSWVAFFPQQIKSAIGNQGTYDASNPDIRYSKRATETKEFKTWFGGSKATENGRVGGEPLTLYHGTSTSFTEFTPSVQAFYGGGIYLTDNLESAQVFADGSAGAEDPRVLEVFARMERPYEFEAGYAIEEPTNASLVKKIFKGARRKSVLKTLDEQGELTDEISEELQAQGYDGLIVRVPGEPAEFVVFEPTQAKSATDNTGGFDASNPDIRYSQAKVKVPTQAPEASFIAWFQKSKVVDAKGTPLVVYHGSPDATFNSFDPDRAGAATKSRDARAGFFFSDDKDFASHFTERRVFDSLTGQRIPTRSFGAAGIKDVYLSLQNPLDLRKVSPEVARAVAATKAMGRYATPEEIMALGRSAAGSKEIQENLAHARTELEALGYDGIINKVKHQGRVRTEFIAFKPAQIKSASTNRGTFDPSNSDIRFSQVRPTPEPTPNFMEFLQRCQDGHEAGFHFEEGGCWGMALALQEQVGGQLMVRDGFVHAYVLLNGTLYDGQGEAQWIEGLRALTIDEFYVEAVANGVSREEVDADKDWALRIIDGAREWASERAAIKAKHTAAIAAGFFEAPADTDYSMAQIFPEPLREWFGASRVTVDGQQGGAPLLVFRGASEGDVDMGGIDPVGGLAAQHMDVFWATSSRVNASFFAEDEIQNVYIRLENPLVLRSANPSPAVVATRILAEVRAGRASWDGVIFEDIVDGSHPSVVYAVFPKERSVRDRIRIVGRTRYAPDGTPIHEGLMPSADPVEFTRGDVIRHDDTTDTEDESPASVVMRARA